MLILRTRRRRGWLGLLYWLLLCSLPGSGRTPSARRQTVGRWRWRCRRKAGTSAAPGHGECCNASLKDTLNKHKQVQFCCHVHTHTNTHKHFARAAQRLHLELACTKRIEMSLSNTFSASGPLKMQRHTYTMNKSKVPHTTTPCKRFHTISLHKINKGDQLAS